MSMQEFGFEHRERDPAGRVRCRDLAAAWLAVAAIGAALFLLPGPQGAGSERGMPGQAPPTAMHDESLTPDGIGEQHRGIEMCSVREYADERC